MLLNKKLMPLAATALLSLFAVSGLAIAGEREKANLGPVGPYQPILATVGDSRLIAYYEPQDGKCDLSAVMVSKSSKRGNSDPARVRVALHPGELFNLDSANGERVVLTCAPDAKALTVLNPGELNTKSASRAIY